MPTAADGCMRLALCTRKGQERRLAAPSNGILVEEAPGGLAMDEDDRLAIARPFVWVVDSERSSLAVRDLRVVRGKREVRQAGESFVGRTKELYRG
jgi:hypothetical protein